MSRDRIKDDRYFEEYIIEQNKRIDKFKSVANQENDTEKKGKLYRVVANLQKDLFSAQYSIGADIEELKMLFHNYLSSVYETSISDYGELIDVISIGYLLGINITDIVEKCDLSLKKDGLIDSILSKKNMSSLSLIFEDYYAPFYMYLSGAKDLYYLEEYMHNSWYENSTEFSWFDSDKSCENVYVGYWCWLAAAVIKIRGDKVSNNLKYVPTDLI